MAPRIDMPARRMLHAYAYDPLLAELNDTVVTLSVPYEPVVSGPVGSLVKVIDYDPIRDIWYAPIDLDDPRVLAQDGLTPSEADPRFHQQMVYAVATSVIEHFEAALGRRFRFTDGPLPMFPHGFSDQNAYYDPDRRAILFGYFRADRLHPGPMLPGQLVFTCLSHDIIAHELTHALVDRLRPRLMDPTHHDVAAFHEAFADLVALFHHFTLPDLVRRHLAASGADLSKAEPLVDLARQFGEAGAMGRALRSGIDSPDPSALTRTLECHDRGAILVGAVFAGFVDTYEARIADLIRIATSGTGRLPPGSLPPDLVTRIAGEAISNAVQFLTICVRAIDYLPVVDVRFGDFLRALVTADRHLFPDDRGKKRATLVETFRRRGIYPEDVASLAEGTLVWVDADHNGRLPGVGELVRWTAEDSNLSTRDARRTPAENMALRKERFRERDRMAHGIHDLIVATPEAFGFHRDTTRFKVVLSRFHASFRGSEDSQPRVDVVVEALQRRPDLEARPELRDTGLSIWAGTTIVADALGRIRNIIPKRLPRNPERPFHGPGSKRFEEICAFVADRDAMDVTRPWTNRTARITNALSLAQLHRDRIAVEDWP